MAERVVPSYPEDSVPISGLDEFQSHLQLLENDPSIPFNLKLFDDIELQLTADHTLHRDQHPTSATNHPPTTHANPQKHNSRSLPSPFPHHQTSLSAILHKHTRHSGPPSILTALASPLPGANLLALAILHKAAKSPSDAAILSTLPEVVEELVRRWLDSPDVSVGERAAKVLGDILETDCEVIPGEGVNGVGSQINVNGTEIVKRRVPGHARLWRFILLERPILSLIKSFCSPETADPPTRSSRQISLSQGRLLRLLIRLATLDIRAINRTAFPDLFELPSHVVQVAGQGLLQWAAIAMVDKSDDILMHLTLIDFFESFVSIMRVSSRSTEEETTVKNLVRAAVHDDAQLNEALRSLPDRTVEEEAEPLRKYIAEILG
ncbi:hypothetical protein PT974_02337 [Cladobotryum mycophilum]|uniref:DNA mismatch repair protein HSM3 N-terminal domain-containing protein n=1 Tax=Cladobotryum mycophilum TaxID=491253 RepID=A0ABR0SXT4_9HYPO